MGNEKCTAENLAVFLCSGGPGRDRRDVSMLGLFGVMQPRVGDEVVPCHLVPLLKLAELRTEPISIRHWYSLNEAETGAMHAWRPQGEPW